jgi:hypothetical protein
MILGPRTGNGKTFLPVRSFGCQKGYSLATIGKGIRWGDKYGESAWLLGQRKRVGYATNELALLAPRFWLFTRRTISIGAIESALLPTSSLGLASSAAPVHVTISNRQEVLHLSHQCISRIFLSHSSLACFRAGRSFSASLGSRASYLSCWFRISCYIPHKSTLPWDRVQ